MSAAIGGTGGERRRGRASAPGPRRRRAWRVWSVVVLLVAVLSVGGWFYFSFVRQTAVHLAAGIDAVLGGGSNSLVVADGGEVLVVDPKFPPGSRTLERWLRRHGDEPVGTIVNTHYHYDHTQGNALYPDAAIYAYHNVPEFMRADDPEFWGEHPEAVPARLVEDDGTTLRVGRYAVELHHAAPAHTHGDLWVYLPQANVVATGDILFHTYYPFMDLNAERGMDLPGTVEALRGLAARYPDARFVPGHGPLATAADLRRYADYLDNLWRSVSEARAAGKSEAEAVDAIDLSRWRLGILPSFHHGLLPEWATAKHNVQWVYRMQSRENQP